jgi:hypothetical protein
VAAASELPSSEQAQIAAEGGAGPRRRRADGSIARCAPLGAVAALPRRGPKASITRAHPGDAAVPLRRRPVPDDDVVSVVDDVVMPLLRP